MVLRLRAEDDGRLRVRITTAMGPDGSSARTPYVSSPEDALVAARDWPDSFVTPR